QVPSKCGASVLNWPAAFSSHTYHPPTASRTIPTPTSSRRAMAREPATTAAPMPAAGLPPPGGFFYSRGMPTDDATWKRCNSCKRPIGFGAAHFTCSVSTCNRKGTDFVFCSVDCWDAHVPVLRHRDAWADEQTAPTAEAWKRAQDAAPAPHATDATPARRPEA